MNSFFKWEGEMNKIEEKTQWPFRLRNKWLRRHIVGSQGEASQKQDVVDQKVGDNQPIFKYNQARVMEAPYGWQKQKI